MQPFVYVTILFVLLTANVSAQEPGKIHGVVNYCDKGGVLGMKISLSGRQASIYTAADGKFLFEQVPAGNYALFYAIDEKMVHVSKDINVAGGGTIDLGKISFCTAGVENVMEQTSIPQSIPQADNQCAAKPSAPECVDQDKDGVVAVNDCNDSDETIRPGAPEICDGIDNNCDGQVDELGAIWIEKGTGICQQGVVVIRSCEKGFADCDGKAANGCETNIMEDNENCGACGNACPASEICAAGMC